VVARSRFEKLVRAACTVALLSMVLSTAGCAWVVIHSAPEKTAVASNSRLATRAKAYFWDALHGALYEELPAVTEALTEAYLEQPADPEIALLLAHAHLWKVSERSRLATQDATITDELILADRYFSEAMRLRPDDRRIAGWQGGVRLALGSIHNDERLIREAYYELDGAARAFPEFNQFSASFAMSAIAPDDPRFPEVVQRMWNAADLCIGTPMSRTEPVYRPDPKKLTTTGDARVCWNSEIAPHNIEGFFLAFGDAVSKSGDAQTARKLYENAKRSPSYAAWPFKGELERRIEEVAKRTEAYRGTDRLQWPQTMINSPYACTGCHAG
jgi:hypothetical protein